MADHVKVYEEKKKAAIWPWLLLALLALALLAYFLTRHKAAPVVTPAPAAAQATPASFPNLGTVHFDTDKADLTPQDTAILDQAADAMKSNPNVHLRLEGYTDSTATDQHNMPLSVQRAYAVANYLKGKGIDGSRLTGEGFAAANPADTNATAAGKADNRRVELFTQP